MEELSGSVATQARTPRIIGEVGDGDGPILVVTAALHGNEPSGLKASRRVLSRLQDEGISVAGRVCVFAGNLTALGESTRFTERDLNRQWTPEKIAALLAGEGPDDAEAKQQDELLTLIRERVAEADSGIFFLDLHTSSAPGKPFLTIGDTLRNRRFASNIPLPLILGLEEQVDGSLLEYLNNRGLVTMGVEAGQHDDPVSVDRHEAVMWLALVQVGMLSRDAIADLHRFQTLLADDSRGIPKVVEVRHRHAIHSGDHFKMLPGFCNFDPVAHGQRLGTDDSGPVLTPEEGRVLLPLYQGQGDDGFFICREVSRVWLSISAVLRRLRLGVIVRLLPGVRRCRVDRDRYIVDTRVARILPLQIFHLFGYRKLRQQDTLLEVSRRRFDLAAPKSIELPGPPLPENAEV